MPDPNDERFHRIGNQFTRLEAPNVVYSKLVGIDDLPAAARRKASEALKFLPLRGTVVSNAPFRAKVLAKLLLTAGNLFRSGQESNPVLFADTEADARQLLEKRRKELENEVRKGL